MALDLPADARARLGGVMRELAPRVPDIRWVREENLHATVRFLGVTTPEVVERLKPGLAAAAAGCAPERARMTRVGTFPERGRARVLWVGLDLPPRFADLHARCEELARNEGFAAEERGFAPHVTLGRWREPVRRPLLPEIVPGEADVAELVLYKSDLSPQGPTYTALARFPLGSAA